MIEKVKNLLFRPVKYRYLFVRFQAGGREYTYRTENRFIKANDVVMAPVANGPDKPAVVTKVIVCTAENTPYPLWKTKMISGRAKSSDIMRYKSRKPVRDDLDWIDKLEMFDAIFDDD